MELDQTQKEIIHCIQGIIERRCKEMLRYIGTSHIMDILEILKYGYALGLIDALFSNGEVRLGNPYDLSAQQILNELLKKNQTD